MHRGQTRPVTQRSERDSGSVGGLERELRRRSSTGALKTDLAGAEQACRGRGSVGKARWRLKRQTARGAEEIDWDRFGRAGSRRRKGFKLQLSGAQKEDGTEDPVENHAGVHEAHYDEDGCLA